MSKNKFFKKLLVAGLCALTATATVGTVVTAAGCKKDDDQNKTQTQEYTVTFSLDGGAIGDKTEYSVKVKDGEKVYAPPTPTKDGYTFNGWNYNGSAYDFDSPVTADVTLVALWTKSVYTITWNLDGGKWSHAALPTSVEAGNKVSEPQNVPTKDDKVFGGWATPDGEKYDFNTPVTGNLTLKAIWNEIEYEIVTTAFDYEAAFALYPTKTTAAVTIGKFTFVTGVQFSSSDINTQGKDLTITLSGETNTITFEGAGASTSADTVYTLSVGSTDVTPETWESTPNKTKKSFVANDLPAGTYTLKTSKSARITNLKISEKLQKSDPVSITVSGGTRKFIIGDDYSDVGLTVTLNYENGRQDVLTSGYTVDSSAYKKDVSGKYTVTVKHTETNFTDDIEVFVYKVDEIKAYDYLLNSKRVTQSLQKIFNKGDTFNSTNLAVQATCSVEGVDGTEIFVLKDGKYTVTSPDMTTEGEKTVTISGYGKTTDYKINVVDLSGVAKDSATVTVDKTANIGVNGNTVTVKTFNDALRIFKILGTSEDVNKVINVAPGEYFEKVEVDIPNVHIVGTGTNAGDTVLVFDAMNGVTDPSGTINYSTDGSATISIRESATGFYAENIEFRNYYNTHALYTEALKITKDTQAVAVLVQADKCVFENVRFSSYHDTLYDMTGRHVYNNCYIEGRTDYIFGYNSTAYFNECTLKTIGAGVTEKNGGYIVATKGCSKGESDKVEYGYIFYKCTLTGDENVRPGSVSLARGWDKYMTLAFIECDISGAYSKEGYGKVTPDSNDNLNDRYTKMNADPVATQLFEYGNTGDGAFEDATAGLLKDGEYNICTIITAERAADFSNFTKIFAAKNGNLSYSDDWDYTPNN